MSYSNRIYRQRNAHAYDTGAKKEQSSFFNKSTDQTTSKAGKSSFFQAKLSVGQPNDKYEQEADAVANAIVNHQPGNAPVVQQKKISTIQRLATPMEEEKLSTNDERMKRDKEIQEKPELQMMCPGCEEEEKEHAVQTKAEGGGTASAKLSSKIEGATGKGKILAGKTLSEMNDSFGVDFSNVSVHTDSDATQMNKELGAQAFTHGSDIYFNSGKYKPESTDGKQLLAHELTHVVQQGYATGQKHIQRFGDFGFEDFNLFGEEEEETTTAANEFENPFGGTSPLGSLFGNTFPGQLGLPAWDTSFLDITLMSPNATCIGSASPTRVVPMSNCNASHFCTIPANFNFNLFFHYDADIIIRPQPFSDADVTIGLDFIPDGQLTPTFSKHQSGKGVYNGPGNPLKVPFGNNFSFSTNSDGTFFVFAQMVDSASGKTVTYIDSIRCTIIPCT
ncbi:MAG: DUF4157 domain-containing protein [Chitinophagaceae bacterium]